MRSLFGRKKSAPPQENPYAQQQAQEEYDRMTPYQRARADLANNPRPNVPGGLPSGPGPRRESDNSPAQSTGTPSFGGSTYAGSQDRGYSPNQYGSNQGYGLNRFDSTSTAFSPDRSAGPTRPGGYGGFSPAEPADTSELYGGATPSSGPNRYARQPSQPNAEQPNRYAPGADPGQGGQEEGNDYADQDLTPEQREEQEFRTIKNKQKDLRRQMDASTDNSLATLGQIFNVNDRVKARIAQQGESLNHTERAMNMSSSHAKHAEAQTKELQHVSRSMFAISNPVTKSKRQAEREQAFLERNQLERADREALGRAQYQDNQRNEESFNNVEAWRAKRDKYKFADDDGELSSDEEGDDDEVRELKARHRDKMALMLDGVTMLKGEVQKTGQDIMRQNATIDRIAEKTDGVTDHVVKNSAKLRTFK